MKEKRFTVVVRTHITASISALYTNMLNAVNVSTLTHIAFVVRPSLLGTVQHFRGVASVSVLLSLIRRRCRSPLQTKLSSYSHKKTKRGRGGGGGGGGGGGRGFHCFRYKRWQPKSQSGETWTMGNMTSRNWPIRKLVCSF